MYERIRALREDRDLLHAMAEKATKTAVVSEGRVSLSARTLAALPHPVAGRHVPWIVDAACPRATQVTLWWVPIVNSWRAVSRSRKWCPDWSTTSLSSAGVGRASSRQSNA